MLTACLIAAAILALLAAGTANAQEAPKVLVYQGTPNATTNAAVTAIQGLGTANGFGVDVETSAATAFTAAKLSGYRAVVFLANGDTLDAAQESTLKAYVEGGGGFLSVGNAVQAETGSTTFDQLLGARPGTSPAAEFEAVVEVADRAHAAGKGLPLEWTRTDQWFNWASNPAGNVHTVASLRERGEAGLTNGLNHPIAWCRDQLDGRTFVTAMGRTAGSYAEDNFKKHLLGAIQWSAGLVRGNCKATINSNYKATRLTQPNASGQLNMTGEPHGLDIAADGRIVYIGRAAGRSIITDWNNPSVGLGAGTVHVYDPDDGSVTTAAILDVFGNKGNGGETTKIEEGLLGIALAKDFLQTGHVYLHWTPHNQINRTTHMGKRRVSRFTMNLNTNVLDVASEKVILQWDVQIDRCCHGGGGMAWDSKGNLYIATGDTNSSGCDGCSESGYSGNNALPRFPAGTGIGLQDARRTAGNTNNLNGKILRIKPLPDPGPTPGEGLTYTVPPNNLFNGTEEGGGKSRREIFAMGVRNPSRIWVDPVTDWVHAAWVGPDAGSPSVNWGPAKYESAAVMAEAGNYGGWPYCMGNLQPYRDRSNTNQNTPLDWYDCDDIKNTSPHNDGMTNIPDARPVNIWYGNQGGCPDYPRDANGKPSYIAGEVFERCDGLQGGGQAIMNGPVYRYDPNSPSTRKWPQYWDGKWFLGDFQTATNARHALTLDPATAPNGGLPTHFDSLLGIIPASTFGSSALMDWKFGPDGALYVQHYGGNYFGIGSASAVWRFEYTGGGSTPSVQATGQALGALRAKFVGSRSGGMSYEWDFGDGQKSTQADPEHTYATAGQKNVTFKVTYADGETSTQNLTVSVTETADTQAPVTTAAFTPAQPGNGGTYTGPVKLKLNATDAGGSGVAKTEYRIDGAASWTTYTDEFTVSALGPHTVEFRSTDGSNNVEATKQVTFTITEVAGCDTALTDEFNGTALASKWEVLRPDAGAPITFGGGGMRIPIRNGDMIGTFATARNVVLQPAPSGPWTVTTKLNISQLTQSGEQAGILIWASENPNTFAKILFINKGATGRWFERVLTVNNVVEGEFPNTGALDNIPDDVYMRARYNGQTISQEYSFNGTTWLTISDPITVPGQTLKLGVKASDTADSTGGATFDWFRVTVPCDPNEDLIPPTSSASVDPSAPNGADGWYTSAPKVTLTATDNQNGSGVERIEYKIDGAAAWTQYGTAPLEVSADGAHAIQYRAVDADGNEETPKTLSLKVDATKATTEATLDPDEPGAGGEYPEDAGVKVALDADDGTAGSGVKATEYRVDGGDWKPYLPTEETIFDGTAMSLARWAQAGPGSFQLQPDGSIQSQSGLGMLWYPVKEYGDFSLKFEWRDAQTSGTGSNGGVFVRFPDPRIPDAQRNWACNVGNAKTQPSWVAIYCGHELQMYDGTGSESQKSGSIYNFSPNDLTAARPVPKGEWSEYEVRVVGQLYTIIRDGVVIKEFDNAIDRNSSRPGDPPTQARRFAKGYIGLQNHSPTDVIQVRDVRVQELVAGATPGPFEVTGKGEHKVEFRSTDTAGNVEDTKSVSFWIGAKPADPGDPDPDPGTGGTGSQPGLVIPNGNMPRGQMLGAFDKVTSTKLASFRKSGLKLSIACATAGQGTISLQARVNAARKLKRTVLGTAKVTCASAGAKVNVTLKPTKAAKKAIRKSQLKSFRAKLVFASGKYDVTRSIQLGR